jgi:hypothetical protein
MTDSGSEQDAAASAWRSYRDSADLVTIVVRPVESPEQIDDEDAADTAEQWVVVSNGANWDQQWLVQEVEALGLSFPGGQAERRGDYVLRVNETRFSWGADTAQYEILLWLAEWAATSAAWDLLKGVSKKMASRLNDSRETTATEFLTDVEAEARARWLLSRRYGENDGSLVLETIETRDDGTATVSFSSPSQWEYEVDLILEDGIVTMARVKRSRRSP